MKLKIFALKSSSSYGKQVADYLGHPLREHEEYCFEDGECYAAPSGGIKENVRGCDVFVIASLYSDKEESVNDKLIKSLILCGALKDASASRITLVAPYLPYARQDRKTASRAPITTKYLSRMLTSLWIDRLLCIDVHNSTAIQNAYPIPCDLLEANILFARQIQTLVKTSDQSYDLVVLSPDAGGLGRARKFRKILSDMLHCEVGIACLDKIHEGRKIKGFKIMGSVENKDVVIFDDMISSGQTTLECIKAVNSHGGRIFSACATHGLFVGGANEKLHNESLSRLMTTDTIPPFRLHNPAILDKLQIVSTTKLVSDAISRIHMNESISDLLDNGGY